MCAVGCIIPDAFYTSSLEDKRIRNILIRMGRSQNKSERYFALVLQKFHPLLDRLQDIHDNYEVESWSSRFRGLAKHLGLTFHEDLYKELL